MKRLLLAASAVVLAGAPALAADLGGRSRPYYGPPVALFNWTGFYVGGNVGWGWASALGTDPSGYLIGLQAGYNFQLASGLLAGFETDIAISGIDGSSAAGVFELDYLGTVRGRLGYTVDRFMLYGTAGMAYGRGDVQVGGLSNEQMHVGWTIGAGVEAFLAPNITARLEYLYADLGNETYQTALGPRRVGFDANILRMGMNYKF
ncbi:MAG: porin family protein [Bradyrhizobiaceae bacterium]|nr:porin family protein [Bradyrhizobiaceae bacterium]